MLCVGGAGGIWDISVSFANFCSEPKMAIKKIKSKKRSIENIFKKEEKNNRKPT